MDGCLVIKSMIVPDTKICTKCQQALPCNTDSFYAQRAGRYGLMASCKECERQSIRRNVERRKSDDPIGYLASRREIERRYREGSREKVRETYRSWASRDYRKNPEKWREKAAKHRHRKLAEDSARYRQKNRDRSRKWQAANPESLRITRKKTDARRQNDPWTRLARNTANLVRHCLMTRNLRKSGRRTEVLLGYSTPHLKIHLECQFMPGMSWENYGTAWHIDHILPVTFFNFQDADSDEFRRCWALTNLRPLWAERNLSKGARRELLL